MDKTLSVAFIWHMHQPSYKDKETNLYIMPWVRLHAVKDYLDMLLILDEFPNIKQTFNLVPLLIDQLEDYANNEAHDIHSKLTVRDIVDFTQEDKLFVLGHFFDANYTTQIEPHEEYAKLYQRAYVTSENLDEKFSDQDYSDIMMWFNLVWFDPSWVEKIPELKAFKEKGKDFSFEDRKRLIEIQREIISQIIPSYRKYWEEGKIEISTSPYYHPIIPLLINYDEEFKSASGKKKTQLEMDAKDQVLKSFEKFEKVFGNRPKGIWPSEQCIDQQTLKLFASLGVNWTISDEGVLSKTARWKKRSDHPHNGCS